MSRDYKPSPERSKNSSKGNPFLTGLLIGILLGVAASLSVVMFIKGGDSPFATQTDQEPKTPLADKIIADSKAAKAAAEKDKQATAENNTENTADNTGDKARFDFYTMKKIKLRQTTSNRLFKKVTFYKLVLFKQKKKLIT
jgi:hypothetical protein